MAKRHRPSFHPWNWGRGEGVTPGHLHVCKYSEYSVVVTMYASHLISTFTSLGEGPGGWEGNLGGGQITANNLHGNVPVHRAALSPGGMESLCLAALSVCLPVWRGLRSGFGDLSVLSLSPLATGLSCLLSSYQRADQRTGHRFALSSLPHRPFDIVQTSLSSCLPG